MRIPDIRFIKSVADIKDVPAPHLPQVAMAGRSNVGKSSMINSVFNRKNLAKISSTPGKTQLINYFCVDNVFYLVDLPGYGFSKVSKQISRHWEKLIIAYLTKNPDLRWVNLLIDSRHDLMELDRQMISWLTENAIPFVIILTKCDKISNSRLSARLNQLQTELSVVKILPYSSRTHRGRDNILNMFSELKFPA